jgi:hypothetical protein
VIRQISFLRNLAKLSIDDAYSEAFAGFAFALKLTGFQWHFSHHPNPTLSIASSAKTMYNTPQSQPFSIYLLSIEALILYLYLYVSLFICIYR